MTEAEEQRAKYIGVCLAKDTIQMNNSKGYREFNAALRSMSLGKGWWTPARDAFRTARKEMIRRDKRDK